MSAKHNLVCEQGTTFTLQFTVKTGDVAWNLTNYTATMTVRPFVGSPITSVLATNANGKIVLGGAAGTVVVTLSSTETAALDPSRFVYDFILDSGAVVTRLLEGKFVVTPAVTA
jgi:hypothetical protein